MKKRESSILPLITSLYMPSNGRIFQLYWCIFPPRERQKRTCRKILREISSKHMQHLCCTPPPEEAHEQKENLFIHGHEGVNLCFGWRILRQKKGDFAFTEEPPLFASVGGGTSQKDGKKKVFEEEKILKKIFFVLQKCIMMYLQLYFKMKQLLHILYKYYFEELKVIIPFGKVCRRRCITSILDSSRKQVIIQISA